MKKEFWVDLRSWNKEYAVTAIESGADRLVLDGGSLDEAKRLGRIKAVVSSDSANPAAKKSSPKDELVLGEDVFEVEITDKKSENDAVKLSKKGYVVVKTTDWNVIPLENLAAQSEMIIAAVSDAKEAAMALGVLEKGVSGIMLKPSSPSVISEVAKLMKENSGSVELMQFKVKSVEPVGMGDRVCVDTCSLLKDGEGMMIGSSSSAFLLVHAETLENPYVAPRPFRVNAGAVHAYAV
ncbi:MAG: 3-dehydroquinate synthase II, partial [Methanomicrobium sp.]|nr:3-dehydroquinate synthase II [Methanomicrobium sp.]